SVELPAADRQIDSGQCFHGFGLRARRSARVRAPRLARRGEYAAESADFHRPAHARLATKVIRATEEDSAARHDPFFEGGGRKQATARGRALPPGAARSGRPDAGQGRERNPPPEASPQSDAHPRSVGGARFDQATGLEVELLAPRRSIAQGNGLEDDGAAA